VIGIVPDNFANLLSKKEAEGQKERAMEKRRWRGG